MPLSLANPPADGKAVLIAGLSDLAGASAMGAAAAAPGVQVMDPHPVYELGLNDLAAGKGYDAAQLSTWRYLLVAGQNIVQAAEISGPPAGGGPSSFQAITTGYAQAMEAVFDKAEKLPEVVSGNYEIRALRVPSLYVTALWLKDKQGNNDRFLLVPPAFPPFNTSAVYDRGDLLQLLHSAAKTKQAQESKLQFP